MGIRINKKIGYNIECGGNNSPISESTKQKLREKNLGKVMSAEVIQKIKDSTTGEKNHFYGKNHTTETREKMINSWKTREPASEESRAKMSKSQTGRKHPETVKEKISKANKGLRRQETPVILYDKDLNVLSRFNNVPDCAEFIGCCTRNIYDTIYNFRLVSKKYYILKESTCINDIEHLKNKYVKLKNVL